MAVLSPQLGAEILHNLEQIIKILILLDTIPEFFHQYYLSAQVMPSQLPMVSAIQLPT